LEIYISRGEGRGSHLCLFWSRTWISIRIFQLSLHWPLSLSSCVLKFDVCQGVFHAVVVVYIVKFLLFNNVVNIWLIDWCLWCVNYTSEGLVWFMVFNATFNNITVISKRQMTSCVHKMCERTYGQTNMKRAITLAKINHPWNRYNMHMLRSWPTKVPNMNKMRQDKWLVAYTRCADGRMVKQTCKGL
jgi:hypothetical protein